ncbi:hypothetical protein RhiJN_28475 [Ceratobasidium sp. AG-Ba]|nr:hypothetical protein RhiJN_28475 [Ceratobasidium sp. AG-Ba]
MSNNLCESLSFCWSFSILTCLPAVDWDAYVYTEAFNKDCIALSARVSSGSNSSNSHEFVERWDDASGSTPVGAHDHDVPKLEAYLYFHGLRGNRKLGPKLIFRTSKDVFSPPSGPFQDVVQLLDNNGISVTSIDLVRFGWKEGSEDGDIKFVSSRNTVWVGVLPDSTNSNIARNSAMGILKLLEGHGVDDLEVAFRESRAHPLAGPILYAPVEDDHPLKTVLDWLTTPLSLPIAGLKTLHMQGTLGFFFTVGDELYGVTARHVLFPDTEGNRLYKFETLAPKKKVVLMGNRAFRDLLAFVQARIGTLSSTAIVLQKKIDYNEPRAAAGNSQAVTSLAKFQQQLEEMRVEIDELRRFYAVLRKDWANVNDRVIGYVVWSPPITGSNAPHGYTKDVCVIRLDKDKFQPNFRGNGLDLGTEIESGALMSLLYPGPNVPSEFDYPQDRIYMLKLILGIDKITEPDSKDSNGDPTRFVIKRGHTTKTTIGRLNGFKSFERRYGLMGNFDSFEVAVLPYDNNSGPFSRGGDSGAAIVGANNDFVAQLTSGSGPTDSSDITYGTPMQWLWDDVIKAEFPNAILFFDPPVHD